MHDRGRQDEEICLGCNGLVTMSRIHLYMSTEPVQKGETVTAQCGAVVNNANVLPLPNPPTESILFCRKCFGQFYLCAVTEGQNAIDLESGVIE